MRWLYAGRLEHIPVLGARVLSAGHEAIAVFRSSDDQIFALLDRCPHKAGPLSQGIVHGHCVTCPLHDWVIDLRTGRALAPDEGAAKAFRVRVEDRHIFVAMTEARLSVRGERPATVAK